MRLIDADALECDTEWSEYADDYISYSKMEINYAPTIDAVPVVRCKDCEHRVEWCGSYGCDEWFCFGDEFTDGTMFCGKGEKKDDE